MVEVSEVDFNEDRDNWKTACEKEVLYTLVAAKINPYESGFNAFIKEIVVGLIFEDHWNVKKRLDWFFITVTAVNEKEKEEVDDHLDFYVSRLISKLHERSANEENVQRATRSTSLIHSAKIGIHHH